MVEFHFAVYCSGVIDQLFRSLTCHFVSNSLKIIKTFNFQKPKWVEIKVPGWKEVKVPDWKKIWKPVRESD